MTRALNIAPPNVLIRYLCLFRRFLVYTKEGLAARDYEAIILSLFAADALHNIPKMLSYYDLDPNSNFHTPAELAAWMQEFPDVVRYSEAPARIIADCVRMFSEDVAYSELGLEEDLSNLDVAPPEQVASHLEQLYSFYLCIRWRSAYPWKDEDLIVEDWTPQYFAVNESLADTLMQVPLGLVHWREFDSCQFAEKITGLWERRNEACTAVLEK